jgi:predicted nucleic acid-binding protein
MKTIVPDASVILKWSLEKEQEPDFAKAFNVLQQFLEEKIQIILPTLWRYEVGNILGLKHPAHARAMMQTLLSYQFDEHPLEEDYCLQVLDFLREVKNITFYDASYHVLAVMKKAVCVTADHLYYQRSKRKGSLLLLADWER